MLSRPVKTILATAVALTGTIMSIGAFVVWKYQDRLIYFPSYPDQFPRDNPEGYRDPSDVDLKYEDVNIKTPDGLNLHGWFVKDSFSRHKPTIIVFQGNAGNIGYRIPYIQNLHEKCNSNVLIVGYRGYSYSEGKPSEKGLRIDSLAVIDHVFSRTDIDVNKIFIQGSSLGGAVALYAIAHKRYDVAGVILENTFTSMSDMVDQVFPQLSRFKSLLLFNHWESIKNIAKIKAPLLFISGSKDELVPPDQMRRLYNAAVESIKKEKLEIEEGDHNSTWLEGGNRYFSAIKNFMATAERIKQEPKL